MQDVKLWTIKNYGWYYNNANDKSASWTGVEYLYKFLTTNKSYGPRGTDVPQDKIIAGDIAQLSFLGDKFEHSLFIINVGNSNDLNTFSVATHTYDALGKKIGE